MESDKIKKLVEANIVSLVAGGLLLFGFARMILPYAENVFFSEGLPRVQYEEKEISINPFQHLTLSAQAAFVWDIERQKPLYVLNESAQLPLASLTKIMTALVASEEQGPDSVVVVDKEAILEEGDHGFVAGEKWRLKDLIDATLLASSNDGAHALASLAALSMKDSPEPETKKGSVSEASKENNFLNKANTKAKELGLNQTFFLNDSGLDVNAYVSGGYGSARDLALLLQHILLNYPSLMEATSRALLSNQSIEGKVHNFENTNKHVAFLPGIFASKTGFTDLAGGNLAVAFDAGISHPVIIVVLGSTAEGRFSDVEQLLFASLESLK